MLHGHRTTTAALASFTANGHQFSNPVHSDGIELDQTTQTLYYMPLMSDTLYAILAPALIYSRSDAGLETAMKTVGRTGPADGLWIDSTGSVVVSALAQNAILKISPDGQVRTLVQDSTRLLWPDTFTENKRGELFFTTSQIHLPPDQRGTYRIYKLRNR
jgi:sugar lactone lactonase YvrE